MNIKEAENRTGLSRKTIRYYEETGLLTVSRAERTGYRQFGEAEIDTLKQIKLHRNLGISIQDIKRIQSGEKDAAEIIIAQIHALDHQINQLQQKRELLNSIMSNRQEFVELISDVEDIVYCDVERIREKLLRMDKEEIVKAAMGASPQVNAFLQRLFPELNLLEGLRSLGRLPIESIEKAQMALIVAVNRT